MSSPKHNIMEALTQARQNLGDIQAHIIRLEAQLATQPSGTDPSQDVSTQTAPRPSDEVSPTSSVTVLAQQAAQLEHSLEAIKRSEEELAHYGDHLAQVVDPHTAELSRAKSRVEALLHNSTEGILLAYPDTGIEQANFTFNTLFACPHNSYLGKPLDELIHIDDRNRFNALIASVTHYHTAQHGEFRARRWDGLIFAAYIGLAMCMLWKVMAKASFAPFMTLAPLKSVNSSFVIMPACRTMSVMPLLRRISNSSSRAGMELPRKSMGGMRKRPLDTRHLIF